MITAQRRTTPSSRSRFVEFVLGQKLDGQIDEKVLQDTNGRVFAYNERMGLAELRFDEWLRMSGPTGRAKRKTRRKSSRAPTTALSAAGMARHRLARQASLLLLQT